MSVTKSRKISSWTFLALLVVSVLMCLSLFMGGSHMEGTNKAYELTGAFLGWVYILTGLTLVVTLCFTLIGFFRSFKQDSKKALTGLIGLVALVLLLVITYAIGNGDPAAMSAVNEDSQKYLTAGWLKTADMVLYSSYALIAATIVLIIWGAIRRSTLKK